MDLISEFGYIISKTQPIDFDTVIPLNSKLRQLYDLVNKQNIENDVEAARIIYKSDKADKKYLMLKRNLVHKLADLVYNQDYYESKTDNYKTIEFHINKELLIAEKLLLQNVFHNPTKIIKKAAQTAEKFFLIDTQVAAAKLFRSVYALKGFPNETQEYDKKHKQLVIHQSYVDNACGMWEKLYAITKFSMAKTPEIINDGKEYSDQIKKWLKEYYSPFLLLYQYRIDIIYYSQSNNYRALFQSINQLNQLIIDYPFLNNKILKLDINYHYALFYRTTNNIKKAQEFINKCQDISEYRAFDKFLIQSLQWDILLKTGDYHKATLLINEVLTVAQFSFLDPYDKAQWYIREAYTYILCYFTNNTDDIKLLPQFSNGIDLNGFLNRTKKAGKDKLGYNINLLIVRILLYAIKKVKEIDKEGNNLKIYYHRYLKDMNSKRTSLFFQYLSKTAAVEFDSCGSGSLQKEFSNELNEIEPLHFDIFEWIPYDEFVNLIQKKFCS